MKQVRTMLFDLDGTILDTNELIIRSFLEALKDCAPEGFCRDNIIPSMGQPLEQQLRLFSGLEDVTHLVAAYREVNLRLHDELVALLLVHDLDEALVHVEAMGNRARLDEDDTGDRCRVSHREHECAANFDEGRS